MTLLRQMWSIGIVLATCVAGSACTSNRNGNNSGLLGPTPPAAPDVLTIDVAEINGPYSFYPSPTTVRSGQIVVWRNSDAVTHHVVFDDGSVDTGTLAAGTLSQPITIGVGNWSCHCAIHPSMVGSVAVLSTAITQTTAPSE
jgi:plastocyanin